MSAYGEENTRDAENHPTLGAEYFAARDVAERFMQAWQDEHAEKLAQEIIKPVLDVVQERVWDAFRDHLLSDTEYNIAGAMRDMVERSVRALLGGEKWANVKYIEYPYQEGQRVRAALAKLHSDPIKDGRIADLEAEVERLQEQLRHRY